jgi:poly(A) polymerase
MKLQRADWQRWPGMSALLRALGGGAGETRFVGGCVRDTLLGLPVNDVDLATRLAPEAVIERLAASKIKSVPTGLAHGTVTAVIGGRPVEVTTLRRDVATDGRRATIAYTDDWCEDAARRDFTINALSVEPATLEVHDYFSGLADLETRRVRFIGDALTRIAEDHLRILRFFRFHARFGAGAADGDALEACTARANDLMALSRERIADELTKLLAVPNPIRAAGLMVDHGILTPVLPEISKDGVERLKRLVERELAAGLAPDPLRRLAALLPADVSQVADVAARLRLSKRAAKRLASAAQRSPGDAEDPSLLAYRLGRDEAVDRILLGDGDPALSAKLADWSAPRLTIGGGDLIGMGLPAGPLVAKTLQAVDREWAQAGFDPDKQAQRALARRLVDQALRDSQ